MDKKQIKIRRALGQIPRQWRFTLCFKCDEPIFDTESKITVIHWSANVRKHKTIGAYHEQCFKK